MGQNKNNMFFCFLNFNNLCSSFYISFGNESIMMITNAQMNKRNPSRTGKSETNYVYNICVSFTKSVCCYYYLEIDTFCKFLETVQNHNEYFAQYNRNTYPCIKEKAYSILIMC